MNTWAENSLSDEEIMLMRRDAVSRVRQMQSQARENLRRTEQSMVGANNNQNNHNNFAQKENASNSKSQNNNMRQNSIGFQNKNNSQTKQANQNQNRPQNHLGLLDGKIFEGGILNGIERLIPKKGEGSPIGKILDILNLDSERLMIGFLIILLLNDGADDMLILALCYIFF